MIGNYFSTLFFIVIFLSLLLVGCNLNVLPNEQLIDSIEPSTPIPNPILSPSPTFCTGWHCEITGIVSIETAVPANQLVSETVKLSQISWCSPTSGEQDTQLDADGKFSFEVYIHDTDSFNIYVDIEGYQPEKIQFGGFDCLYCHCPPIKINLQAEE
jgi:hypothetical protein